METNDNIENDNFKESAPGLFSMNKENPFNVPDGYFDNLSNEISKKCIGSNIDKSTPVFKITFKKILIPLSIAATIIIILLIFFKEHKNAINKTQYAYNDMIGASEYLKNLINNNELDENLIVSEIINDDTTKTGTLIQPTNIDNSILNTSLDFTTDSLNKNKITKDDIIQYLLENDESDELLN